MDLINASKNGNIKKIKLLIENGADVNAKDNDGSTSLIFASMYSNDTSSLDTVKLLLENGADVNAKNNYEDTM